MKKNCCCILLIFIVGLFLIPRDDNMVDSRRYKDLGIVSTKIPQSTFLFWDDNSSKIYMVDANNNRILTMSDDKGSSWSTLDTVPAGFIIIAFYPDPANDRLYYAYYDNNDYKYGYIDLTDDSANPVATIAGNTIIGKDILFYSGAVHISFTVENGNVRVAYLTGLGPADLQDMGDPTARTYDSTQTVIVGTTFYF